MEGFTFYHIWRNLSITISDSTTCKVVHSKLKIVLQIFRPPLLQEHYAITVFPRTSVCLVHRSISHHVYHSEKEDKV